MTVHVSLPKPLAAELEREGQVSAVAEADRDTAGLLVDVVVTTAQAGATVVALAQAPATFTDLTDRLQRWWRGLSERDRNTTVVTVKSRMGPDKTFPLKDVDEHDVIRAILSLEKTDTEDDTES